MRFLRTFNNSCLRFNNHNLILSIYGVYLTRCIKTVQICTASDILNKVQRHVYLGYTLLECQLAQQMSISGAIAAAIVSNVVCCQTNGCNAPPMSAPQTSPAPIVTTFLVRLQLLLPLTLAQFNATEQELFREQMAVAAGLQRTDAGRVAISFAPSSTRRLMSGLMVNVTINMPNASSAQTAAAGLTASVINQALGAVGLPQVSCQITCSIKPC